MDDLDENFQTLLTLLSLNDDALRSQQLSLVNQIYNSGCNTHNQLLSVLLSRYFDDSIEVNCIDGLIFELLLKSRDDDINSMLKQNLPHGIVPLKSDIDIDYFPLQQLLVAKQFQQADKLTQVLLCNLSQLLGQHKRQWLYFTDICILPIVDLRTIDKLWQVHSEGLFGLSVQRSIWLSTNSNWEKFWTKIGWKVNNVSCRYPQEFTWNITAPAGHLPLFNQLRGVQVLAALFAHPAWIESIH
uniref:GUN4-like domain-containing protein n=1 Tax=Liagoropsis maxima TaxID=1653392 RepID=A0A1G4NVN9_9FLOR|nr:Hypothetical protein ycf53 [Liagoropsis maxima]SCW22695.1 Hypothetical protein ycf53 [Liagoropsis maxima]